MNSCRHAADEPRSCDTLDRHSDIGVFAGHTNKLLHLGDNTDIIKLVIVGIVDSHVTLSYKEYLLPAVHGLFERIYRLLSPHLKVNEHIGEHDQPSERHGRQLTGLLAEC